MLTSPLSLGSRVSRRRMWVRGLLATTALLCMYNSACSGISIRSQVPEVVTPGGARVVVKEADDDHINLEVYNQTPYPMVVLRDAFAISTSTGMRNRNPGGLSNTYTVEPNSSHDVNLEFNLQGLQKGEQAALICMNCLLVNNQPVPISPIPLVLQ
jgi:hypothetical protein